MKEFGGILRCDDLITACKQAHLPMYIRLAGNKCIKEHNINARQVFV